MELAERLCKPLLQLFLGMPVALAASRSTGWRGDGTGRFENAGPPVSWSAETNVAWKTKLPNWSNASPALWRDRVFVCSEPDVLVCVSAADGKILWERAAPYEQVLTLEETQKAAEAKRRSEELNAKLRELASREKEVGTALKAAPDDAALKQRANSLKQEIAALRAELETQEKQLKPRTNSVNGYSTPTPTTDGVRVFVVFGCGVVAAYDMDGNRLWVRLLQKPEHQWGHSASPLLADGKLIVHIIDVFALEAETGKTLWKSPSSAAWGSPVLANAGASGVYAVTASGDIVALATGAAAAKAVSPLSYCSPIVSGDTAFFVQHKGKAVRLEPGPAGGIKPTVLWQTLPLNDRYYASPVYCDGLLYAITQKAVLSVIDAANGNVVYSRDLDLGKSVVYPSICQAGKYVYISGDSGATLVIEPGRTYKEISRNLLEPFRSTPVFAGTRMYVRGLKHLYCIGK